MELGGRHGWSQLHNMPLYVANMLILALHVWNRRCWGPDQFVPGFPQGLAHGQFIQVRDYICMGTFVPLTWDIHWGSFQQLMAQSLATCTPVMLIKASTSSRTFGAKPLPSGHQCLPSTASQMH